MLIYVAEHAAEKILQSYGVFLEEYGTQLLRIQEALPGSFSVFKRHVSLQVIINQKNIIIQAIHVLANFMLKNELKDFNDMK